MSQEEYKAWKARNEERCEHYAEINGTPWCRCCGLRRVIISWPIDKPHEAICPDCCEKTPDGHEFKHFDREWNCIYCGTEPSNEWLSDYYSD